MYFARISSMFVFIHFIMIMLCIVGNMLVIVWVVSFIRYHIKERNLIDCSQM